MEGTSHSDMVPLPLGNGVQPSASFVVQQAHKERSQAEEGKGKKRAEHCARGMAQRKTTVEHYEPYSRGVQYFIKFFLGGPNKPKDYPEPPTDQEKESQYWVEKRSQLILAQLERLCTHLANRPVAEQDYCKL